MRYDPDKHHRRSIRLKGYDYSQAGAYFVTICSNEGSAFGEIKDGEMRLNLYGLIVHKEWLRTGDLRDNIQMDAFVVMPNHLHGIVLIIGNVGRGTLQRAPTVERFGQPISNSIPTIIRLFKSTTTKQINELRNSLGAPVWQRNYYEHIIRDEDELNRIREYIRNNQLNWDRGENNLQILQEAINESRVKATR